jgi:Na+/melibiose symporter-like transporter
MGKFIFQHTQLCASERAFETKPHFNRNFVSVLVLLLLSLLLSCWLDAAYVYINFSFLSLSHAFDACVLFVLMSFALICAISRMSMVSGAICWSDRCGFWGDF